MQRDLWWYFPNSYGLQWLWIASKLPLPLPGCDADTAPAIMVLAWPSLTHTGSTENRVTAVAVTQKHGHNVRAEQHYHPPFLITTTQYLEVPMEYHTRCEKPRFRFLFWTRSNISNLLQESHQCYISLIPHFSIPDKMQRLQKKNLHSCLRQIFNLRTPAEVGGYKPPFTVKRVNATGLRQRSFGRKCGISKATLISVCHLPCLEW